MTNDIFTDGILVVINAYEHIGVQPETQQPLCKFNNPKNSPKWVNYCMFSIVYQHYA